MCYHAYLHTQASMLGYLNCHWWLRPTLCTACFLHPMVSWPGICQWNERETWWTQDTVGWPYGHCYRSLVRFTVILELSDRTSWDLTEVALGICVSPQVATVYSSQLAIADNLLMLSPDSWVLGFLLVTSKTVLALLSRDIQSLVSAYMLCPTVRSAFSCNVSVDHSCFVNIIRSCILVVAQAFKFRILFIIICMCFLNHHLHLLVLQEPPWSASLLGPPCPWPAH